MAKKMRLFLILAGILVLLVVIGICGINFVKTPWPMVNGELQVKGLKGKVKIIRDKFGVPNIYADNDYDLFFAQGYVHAQDRFYQMDMRRRIGNGTLSEVSGKRTRRTDRMSRTYGLRRIAEKSYPLLDDKVKAELQAYSDGVNAYIETHKNKLPLEFTIMGYKPEPWTPMDCLVFANFLTQWKAVTIDYEIFRANLTAKLGEKMAQDALPPYDPDNPVVITKELEQYSWKKNLSSLEKKINYNEILNKNIKDGYLSWIADDSLKGLDSINDLYPEAGKFGLASGAFAISGKNTKSGKPMLASDIHMDLLIPNLFYEMGMHGGSYDMYGYSMPAAPYILIGNNKDIAWSFCNLDPDVQDLYIEKFDDDKNPTKYLYKGEWYDIEKVKEYVNVKGMKKPMLMEIMITRHGPIINDYLQIVKEERKSLKRLGKYKGQNKPYNRRRWEKGQEWLSYNWNIHEGCTTIQSVSMLNRAGNWDEFRDALRYWDALGENFVYIDNQGNIGYQAAGKIPIRNSNHVGAVPVPGWTGDYEWKGFIPFDDLPYLYNPPTGYVASANNKVTTDDYPYLMTYDWYHPGYRARRLVEILDDIISSNKKVDYQDLEKIQADTFSYAAMTLNQHITAIQPDNPKEEKILEYAKQWDFKFDLDSIGATIFQVWYSYFDTNTLEDEVIKHEIWGYNQPLKRLNALITLAKDPTNTWFDNVNTDKKETLDDIARESFKNAVKYLKRRFGSNPSKWTFDKLQKVNIRHFALRSTPILKDIFNSYHTLPISGSFSSFAMTYSSTWAPKKYNVRFAVTLRNIFSFSDVDKTKSIIHSGVNGHLLHPNRDDQMKMWVEHKYRDAPFTKEGVEKIAQDTLILYPEK